VHAGAFNLGLLLRQLTGRGTPRRLQGRVALWFTLLIALDWVRDGLSNRPNRAEPVAPRRQEFTIHFRALPLCT
jgi:hypothetical protein